jgi:predicted RecA/RadA family phage recombinase
MATNYRHEGAIMHFLAPGGGVVSGTGYVVGDTFGIAAVTNAAGILTSFEVEGVFELPKLSTDVVAQGVKVYWDDAAKRVTVTATGNKVIGCAEGAAGAGVATVFVRLVEGPAL